MRPISGILAIIPLASIIHKVWFVGIAIDAFEVSLELSGPNLILVFGPCVLDVLGGNAGGEAAQARGEIDQAGEVGDAEMFLTLGFVEVDRFASESNALIMKLPFLVAKCFGAFAGQFLTRVCVVIL